MAETESLQALSTRKLVLETGKFNVLTAHSTTEALDLIHLFPNISMADLSINQPIDCARIAREIKATSRVPIIALSPRQGDQCDFADHTLSGYEPESLLALARSMLGDPQTKEPPSAKE